MRAGSKHLQRWLAVAVAAGTVAGLTLAGAGQAAAKPAASRPEYQATIVRTAFGIPHITARSFGSLGYGYGFALASDDLCTMASGYITVEGQSSRYLADTASNLNSDFFWQSVIDRRVIPRLLAVRTGPDAIGPQLRRLVSGYVAGYNRYLASVGGAKGVPNLACRGKPWVKPITALDAYLLIYRAIEMSGQAADPGAISAAHPPASAAARPSTQAALLARAASVARTPPGAGGLPSARQFREAAGRLPRAGLPSRGGQQRDRGRLGGDQGSRARHAAGQPALPLGRRRPILRGAAHHPWRAERGGRDPVRDTAGRHRVHQHAGLERDRIDREFLHLLPAGPRTRSPHRVRLRRQAGRNDPPGSNRHGPSASGTLRTVRRTLWSTRYGPVYEAHGGLPLPWTTKTAFALDDANARNFRFLNHFLAADEAHSAARELTILRKYEGLPWANTLVADSTGHALYADILVVPDVTNAEAARCDTAIGKVLFQAATCRSWMAPARPARGAPTRTPPSLASSVPAKSPA